MSTGLRAQLTFDPTFKDQTPDWSPDGQVIAYHADDDIWRMAADGHDQVNLTQTPSVAEFGTAFSPDGTRISFTGTGGPVPAGERYVQVMAADGSNRRLLAPTPACCRRCPPGAPGSRPLSSSAAGGQARSRDDAVTSVRALTR